MQIFDALEAQHNMSDLSKTFVLYDIGARQKILPIMHDQLLLDRTYLVLRKKLYVDIAPDFAYPIYVQTLS